jgi:hypothetical protein
MAPGITLAIVGAVLTFAVRAQPSFIDLRVVGLILMIAGAGLIWHSRRGTTHERVITRVRGGADPRETHGPVRGNSTSREIIEEREYE